MHQQKQMYNQFCILQFTIRSQFVCKPNSFFLSLDYIANKIWLETLRNLKGKFRLKFAKHRHRVNIDWMKIVERVECLNRVTKPKKKRIVYTTDDSIEWKWEWDKKKSDPHK